MDNYLKIGLFVAGLLAGMFVYSKFFVPEFTTEYVEKIVIDTAYKEYREKYLVDSISKSSLSDSVEFYKSKYEKKLREKNIKIVHDTVFNDKPFEAPLRRFTGSKPFLYGNTSFDATVAGELLDIELSNNFRIPTITNTITKETRTVIKPSGLYGAFGVRAGDQQLTPLLGATYLKDKSMIYYNYDLKLRSHQAGIGVKIIGR